MKAYGTAGQRTATSSAMAWQSQISRQHQCVQQARLAAREHELFPRFSAYYQGLNALPRRWRRGIGRELRRSLAGIALLLALGNDAALAATISVDGITCTLADAITAANTDTATGGCSAGSGGDILDIQNDLAPGGSPAISSEITIEGNGHTIQGIRLNVAGTEADEPFTLNDSTISGDGVWVEHAYGEVNINRSTITGAGVDLLYVYTNVNISGSTITGANKGISGAYIDRVSIRDSLISDNERALDLYHGNARVYDSTIQGNGETAYMEFGSATFSDSTVSGNGGGIWVDLGGLRVYGSTLSDSGEIATYGASVYIDDSTLSNGGGVYVGGASLYIENSTISGNSGSGAEWNGWNDFDRLEIINSTITGNSGSGILMSNDPQRISVARSIVSGNGGFEVANFYNGGIQSFDFEFNLLGDSSRTNAEAFRDFSTGPTNITATSDGTDPTALGDILDPVLQDNGGPTETHALVTGSLAIDAAPGCPPPVTDQRGIARPQGVACDIGAYEREELAPSADLAITKSVEPDPGQVGEALRYTLTLTNRGPDEAQAVRVFDRLREPVVVAHLPDACRWHQGQVTCRAGRLLSGETVSYDIVVRPKTAGRLGNIAFTRSRTPDPDLRNNRDRLVVPVNP